MNTNNAKLRFLTTVIANIIRLAISFITGLVIARVLGPSEYGNFDFLCGSFTSLAAFVNMSSSTAFYTFISQRQRGRRFFLYYGSWVLIQFLILLCFVLFLSGSLRKKFWLGHPLDLVILALFTSFSMNQLWTFVSQLGESIRDTVGVQMRNLALLVSYLVSVTVLAGLHIMDVKNLFILNIFLYLLFSALYAWRLYRSGVLSRAEKENFKTIFEEFRIYCLPLVAYTGVVFIF